MEDTLKKAVFNIDLMIEFLELFENNVTGFADHVLFEQEHLIEFTENILIIENKLKRFKHTPIVLKLLNKELKFYNTLIKENEADEEADRDEYCYKQKKEIENILKKYGETNEK